MGRRKKSKKFLTNEKIAYRVIAISITINLFLTAIKLAAGLISHSTAMISEAVHSLSDLFGTLIVTIGIKLGNKRPDSSHQYGHERLESVAAILLSGFLLAIGLGIGWMGVSKILDTNAGHATVPGVLALIVAGVSIAIKEAAYWYTRAKAKRINSGALMAEAWHHRSDSLACVGVFVGVLGARLGLPILDPIACLVICVFIIKAAVDIFRDAVSKMTDKSCDPDTVGRIREVILGVESVKTIDALRTRLFGDKMYVEVEISIEGTMSLHEAHQIAQRTHDAIEQNFHNVKHCMVHVNPEGEVETEPERDANGMVKGETQTR